MSITVILGTFALLCSIPLLVWTLLSDGSDQQRVGVNRLVGQRREGFENPYLDASANDRILKPALDRLLRLAKRYTPAGWAQQVDAKLALGGYGVGWTPERVLLLKAAGLAVGLLISLRCLAGGLGSLINLIGTFGAAPFGFFLPDILIKNTGDKRQAQIAKELPDILDQITIGVEAGLGFDSSVARCAASSTGPLSDELVRMLQQIQTGLTRGEALRNLATRNHVPELRQFVSAVLQADQFGIPISQVLRVQSAEQRRKRRQRAEEKAMKLPVKVLFPLVLCILPALFVVIIGPAALQIKNSNFG